MFLTEVGKSENREENDIVKVTGVEITPIKKGDGYYKAVATVYLGEYAVNGILISEQDGKIKLRFPFVAEKERQDWHRTFAFTPISQDARKAMENQIGLAYWKKMES